MEYFVIKDSVKISLTTVIIIVELPQRDGGFRVTWR